MRRLLFEISYAGTRYHGYQVQQNGITVAEAVQDAVERVFPRREAITGYGMLIGGLVLNLAARSWTNQEIADYLNISVNTVKRHISEAMKKLNVENRKDLKQYMLR